MAFGAARQSALDGDAWRRIVAAAAGTLAGVVLAYLAALLLAPVLFEHVAEPIFDSVAGSPAQGDNAIEGAIVAVASVFAGVVVVAMVVVAILAPLFIILPLSLEAVALRWAGADRVPITLLITVGLLIATFVVLDQVERFVPIDVWLWLPAAGLAGGAARWLTEQFRRP